MFTLMKGEKIMKKFVSLFLSIILLFFPLICTAAESDIISGSNSYKTRVFQKTNTESIMKNLTSILTREGYSIKTIDSKFNIIIADKEFQKRESLSALSVAYNTTGLLMGIALSIFTLGICAPVAVHYGVKLAKGTLSDYVIEATGDISENENRVSLTLNFVEKSKNKDKEKASSIVVIQDEQVYQSVFNQIEASLSAI